MSDLSGVLSGSQAISGSLSGGSVLRGGLSMGGGVSPELLLDKADVITDTASGSIVSIPDGMASPVLGLSVDIEPIQAGTGDPSPTNIRPISGRSEVSVTRTGINVWDEEWEEGTYDLTTGQPVSLQLYFRTKNPINVKPNTTYHVIIDGELTESALYWFYYGQNDDYLGYDSYSNRASYNITMSEKCHYARFVDIHRNAYDPTVVPIGVNYPSTYTDYQPYNGQTITVQLGQTVYGGTVDVTSGKLVIKYEKRTISSFTGAWGATSNGYAVFSTQSGTDHSNVNSEYMASNMFKYYSGGRSSAPLYSYGCNDGASTTQTFILPSTITSKDEANSWLGNLGTPLECTFKLATPIEVTLTAEELDILFGDNVVFADSGNVSVAYRCDTKKYILKKIAEALNA